MSAPNDQQTIEQLESQLRDKQADITQYFEEVAAVTEKLEQARAEANELEQALQQLRDAAAAQQAAPEPEDAGERLQQHISLVTESGLFDGRWYLGTYPDVAQSAHFAANPAEHFVLHGGQEGRHPGPGFNSAAYLEQYPDVAAAGMNPLVHYLVHGRSEGRLAWPLKGEA
ncbi:hypothetical protein MLC59_11575 [Marinobacter bryozoorum]|uniref:hypothetical protein n=1 Tax=Marinobacter bryozoorum TaxID=256324 RepID=UPI002003A3DF|nr:hypothetical protein [Marinobacter bryozoorum]MCK7544809.1 hypothetical protein [Marinobacter bryozoorum]